MNLLALLACSGTSNEVADEPTKAPRPDIVLVTLDTTRADRLGCYGHEPADTTVIDGLCDAGRKYTRAYSPAPLTIPSHAAIFTGKHPAGLGIRDNGDGLLEADQLTLTEILKAHGYQTAASVSAFVTTRTWGFDQGFDAYFDEIARQQGSIWQSERRAEPTIDDLLTWAEDRDPTRPTFAWLHLYDVHFPYAPPDEYYEDWSERPYDGELAYVDDQLERVTAVFDPANTLYILVSDHGEGLGEHQELTHGLYVYDSTQHVPLIISGPGVEAQVVDDVVSLMDVTPTVLSLLDIPAPQGIDGQAMPGNTSKPVYMEAWALMNRFGFSPHVGVVDGDHKYIGTTTPELYDLTTDPGETTLLEDPAKREELGQVLAGFDYGRPDNTRLAMDPAMANQLQSLGYIEGSFSGDLSGELPDPKPHAEDILASQKADQALRRGELETAEALLRELATKYPDALEFQNRLASVLSRQGRKAEAAAVLEQALSSAPDDPSVQAALAVHRAKAGRYDEATALFQSSAKALPWAPGLRAMAVASQMSVKGEEHKAVALGLSYLEQFPDDYAVAGLLGVALAKVGSPDARQLLENGAKADRPETEVCLLLGMAVLSEGDTERAALLFQQELENYPRSLRAAQALVTAKDSAKDYQGILEVSSASLVHHPENLQLLHAKTQALFNLKEYAVCRTELDLALLKHPESAALILLDANLLSKEGKDGEGAKRFEEAKTAKAKEDAAKPPAPIPAAPQ